MALIEADGVARVAANLRATLRERFRIAQRPARRLATVKR
jgi:hypothetical protein